MSEGVARPDCDLTRQDSETDLSCTDDNESPRKPQLKDAGHEHWAGPSKINGVSEKVGVGLKVNPTKKNSFFNVVMEAAKDQSFTPGLSTVDDENHKRRSTSVDRDEAEAVHRLSLNMAKAKLDGTGFEAHRRTSQATQPDDTDTDDNDQGNQPLRVDVGLTEDEMLASQKADNMRKQQLQRNSQNARALDPETMVTPRGTGRQGPAVDDNGKRRVCILLPARRNQAKVHEPPDPKSQRVIKSALKEKGNVEERLNLLYKEESLVATVLPRLCCGTKLIKYNTDGRPNVRFFAVSEDGTELYWSKSKLKTDGRSKRNGWGFKEKSRKRLLADVRGVFYGPYNNQRAFKRFLERKDDSEGKDWLCLTIAFDDRTLDFVCSGDREVSNWFTGIQGLAPLVGSHLKVGSLLWRRLIMKLNYYGLDPDNWPGPLEDAPGKKKNSRGSFW